jgi:hypothetical protein
MKTRDPVARSGPVFGDFTKTEDQTSRSGPVLGCCGDRTAQRPRPWSGPGLGAVLVRPDQCMGRSESGSVCERVEKVAGVTAWLNECRYSEGRRIGQEMTWTSTEGAETMTEILTLGLRFEGAKSNEDCGVCLPYKWNLEYTSRDSYCMLR